MYYHSIIKSDERMVTKMVLEQERNQLPNPFRERVSELGKLLNIEIKSEVVRSKKKSPRKKMCRDNIMKKVKEIMWKKCESTKLRFVREDN